MCPDLLCKTRIATAAVAGLSQPGSNAGHDCVEVAHLDGGITKVRDSKNPEAGELTFTRSEWVALVRGVKDGEFDRA